MSLVVDVEVSDASSKLLICVMKTRTSLLRLCGCEQLVAVVRAYMASTRCDWLVPALLFAVAPERVREDKLVAFTWVMF